MNESDRHSGLILTPKTSNLEAETASFGNENELKRDFYFYEVEGKLLHDSLLFAKEFFLEREQLFTTYEEIWLVPNAVDEFEKLYIREQGRLNHKKLRITSCFHEISKFIKIAKNNNQPIIFYT